MSGLLPCPWPVEALLPHAPPMVLLDEALGYAQDRIRVAAAIRPDHPFATPRGVPAHVGIELMAQACGAFAGAHALAAGGAPRLGFLLGTRRYQANDDWFRIGDRLEIWAQVAFRDEEMGVFDCRVERGGEVVAEAQLTVYQPKNPNAVLASQKGDHA
ncbi:MAG: hypothetical protein M0006_01745 [Magnetospirillum sp.]|nr:hypothetical protein [Magnetospirillum sp.]